jgi:hypothetical protein
MTWQPQFLAVFWFALEIFKRGGMSHETYVLLCLLTFHFPLNLIEGLVCPMVFPVLPIKIEQK